MNNHVIDGEFSLLTLYYTMIETIFLNVYPGNFIKV